MMFKGLCTLILMLVLAAPAQGQTIGSIGIGDINYASKDNSNVRENRDVVTAVNQALSNALRKTRKFNVIEYPQLTARLTKQGLTLDGYYKKQYVGADYLQAGLDYILTADITNFGLYKQQRGDTESATGLIEIDFTLLGVADLTTDFKSSVSAQVSSELLQQNSALEQQLLDQAIARGVDQLVNQVLTKLFPIRVVKLNENDSITLNYGQGLLAPGDTILVYPLDQEPPVTADGKALGNPIASLQVISVDTKFAIAQALNGQENLEKRQQAKLVLRSS